jgi:hypothetical protein
MKKNIFIFLFSLSAYLPAQDFSGQIFDKKTNEGIPYAYMGISGKAAGAVSDVNGNFIFPLDDKYSNDTFRISMVGYKPFAMKVTELRKKYGSQPAKIYLEENSYALSEVVVRPAKFKTEVVGNKDQGQPCVSFVGDTTKAETIYEVGTHIKIKKRPTFIDNINFAVCRNNFDSITIRINVYDFASGDNILRKPIYVKVRKGDKRVTVDTKQYNIMVDDDFIIAFEALEIMQHRGAPKKGDKVFDFSGGLFGSDMLIRQSLYSKWEKVPIAVVGFNATITYKK